MFLTGVARCENLKFRILRDRCQIIQFEIDRAIVTRLWRINLYQLIVICPRCPTEDPAGFPVTTAFAKPTSFTIVAAGDSQ